MTSEEQKIIDIVVKYEDAINGVVQFEKQINELKNVQRQLNDQLKAGDIAVEEYNKQMVATDSAVRQYKDNIRVLRNEIKNNLKQEREQIGSLKQLRAELSNANKAYDELSRAEREGAKGTELLKHIQDISDELSTAEAKTRRFYRNVGNYSSAWNGLDVSVQQILRELPSAAVSMNTFFLAISNNIPMLVDQINMLRAANKAAAAEGNATVPVWKSLTSALFSWNTVISLAVTALTLFGGKIIGWIGNLFKAKNATDQVTKSQQEFAKYINQSNEEMRQSVAKTAGEQIAAYNRISRAYNDLGDNMKAKKKFIEENQSAFHDLGFSVSGVSDAENLLVKNTDKVVDALVRRAKAAAYEQRITEATQRYIDQTERNRTTVAGGGYYTRVREGMEITRASIKSLVKDVDYITKSIGVAADGTILYKFTLTAAGAAKENARRNKEAAETLKKNNEEAKRQYEQIVNNAVTNIKQLTATENKLYDSIGVAQYKENKNISKTGTSTTSTKEDDEAKRREEKLQQDISAIQSKYAEMTLEIKQKYLNGLYDSEKDYKADIDELQKQELKEIIEIYTKAGNIGEEKAQEMQNKLLDMLIGFKEQLKERAEATVKAWRTEFDDMIKKEDEEKINAGIIPETDDKELLSRWQEFLNKKMQAYQSDNELMLELQDAYNKASEEKDAISTENKLKKLKEALADVQKLSKLAANAFTSAISSAFNKLFSEEGASFEDFLKTILTTTLSAIEKQLLAYEALILAKEIANKSFAGVASAAGLTALIAAAFEAAKAAVNSFAVGGLVTGKGTGTSDSIPARLSNGESVMTAKATSMFSPLLSTFNQLGGGVPININTSGASVGEDFLAAAVAKGFMMCPAPVVSVEEISRVQQRVKTIQNISRI